MAVPFSLEALSNFIVSLSIMWKGMLGIFIFMGIFFLLIKAFTRIFPAKENESKK